VCGSGPQRVKFPDCLSLGDRYPCKSLVFGRGILKCCLCSVPSSPSILFSHSNLAVAKISLDQIRSHFSWAIGILANPWSLGEVFLSDLNARRLDTNRSCRDKMLRVVPKLCGAKLPSFCPQNPDKNLCPLFKGWGSGRSFYTI
jgi:hypothetical protein